MINLIKKINHALKGIIWNLSASGVLLLIIALLVTKFEFASRLFIGLFMLVLSYAFFYGAYRVWIIKKAIDEFFKF